MDAETEQRAAVSVPDAAVVLSTASTYPESTPDAFAMGKALGYDGIEVMVWTDPVSQDPAALARLAEHHEIPILAIHSPCLLITQRVWSPDPWERLARSVEAAKELGAPTVVVHPPFRWQREYARGFVDKVARLEEESGIVVAVENMYPWRAAGREILAYAPDWDPTDETYAHCTLDLSHTAVSGSDALEMAGSLGGRLAHVHMADGTGSARDEHLVPGRGTQPCADLLERLARDRWTGSVVLEVSTRKAKSREEREADLAEALAFTRLNLAVAHDTAFAVASDGTVEQVDRTAGA
ncbi:MAG TPA: sugar phosphate isomerase/epimerase [Jiangellales bacterium]|nr:sugar phosphate isomerase/epimerase [Jiangellales bacterium]